MSEQSGWFADVDQEHEGEYRWQPCLETRQGHVPCFQVWFRTEAECEQWIRDTVLPANRLLDDEGDA